MNFVFPPALPSGVPVAGSSALFPVRRVFCVGRNYADHAREMGALDQADGREPPFFFTKPADAVVTGSGEIRVNYPGQTNNLHHEVELVIALREGGANLAVDTANRLIFGYAVGLDLTRRDLQAKAKEKGHPWDMSKGFDHSAVLGEITPATQCGYLERGRIWLSVNEHLKQEGDLSMMMWQIPEIIANLSLFVRLEAGDLIFTGTPAGVGPLQRGDVLAGGVDGIAGFHARMV